MPGKIIFSIILIISSYVHADLKKKIQEVNSTVKQIGIPSLDCENCYQSSAGLGDDIESLMKSCVESICPDQNFSLSANYEKMIEQASKPDLKFNQEIAPLINAIARENVKEKISRSNAQLDWLKNAKSLTNPGEIRALNLFISLNSLSDFQLKNDRGIVVVDVEKSRISFSTLNDDEFKKRVQITNKLLEAFMDLAIPDTDPGRIQLYYPGNEFKERVNDVLSSFESKRKIIISDPDLKFLVNLKEVNEMASGKKLKSQFASMNQINPAFIQDLNRTNSFMNLVVSLSTDPEMKKLLDSPPVDIKKLATELGAEKLLQDRIEKQKFALNRTNKVISNKCKVAFSMAQVFLPTPKQVDSFRNKVSSINGKFFDKTKGLMCPESSQKYHEEVASWVANFPLTSDQNLANMKSSLGQALQESKIWKEKFDEIEKSPNRDAFYSIGMVSLREDYSEPTAIADSICNDLMPNIIPDATIDFSKNFVIGPMVVRNENAEGISYHELGHKLFHFMKNQSTCTDRSQFSKIRSCLLMNHSEMTPDELAQQSAMITFGGDSKYESEDWADLVSSLVDNKTNNFACLFVRKIKNQAYSDLSLKNSSSADPHSSDLFRLLHLNFLKTGKLPVQCERALSARGEKANFKNCLNP